MNIFAIFFFCGLVSLSKSLSDPPSVVSADRICKPGPPLKRTPGKTNCLIIGDSVSIGQVLIIKLKFRQALEFALTFKRYSIAVYESNKLADGNEAIRRERTLLNNYYKVFSFFLVTVKASIFHMIIMTLLFLLLLFIIISNLSSFCAEFISLCVTFSQERPTNLSQKSFSSKRNLKLQHKPENEMPKRKTISEHLSECFGHFREFLQSQRSNKLSTRQQHPRDPSQGRTF